LQDFDHARLTKEARAQNNLACPIKETRALNVETNSENTIIVHILKGSNLVESSKSRTIHIDFTSCTNLTALRRKDKIKAKKADGAKSRD
jgi:hypothetical protein